MACDEENGRGFTANWTMSRKACDSCKTSPAQLFCRADSAFLCINCDSKVHGANKLASRHERVVVCEVCEQAPASVTCKADAAALCVTCDRDIHSANPLARRHERFPVVPFYVSSASAIKSNAVNLLVPDAVNLLVPDAVKYHDRINGEFEEDEEEEDTCREEAEAASWLLPNPNPKQILENPSLKSGDYLFSDVDPYLDLDYPFQHHQNSVGAGADSVVPVQTKFAPPLMNNSSSENFTDMDFCRSKPSYSYTTQSLSHSVSSSSMDVGVVPDGNSSTTVDISNPFGRQMKSGVDLTGSAVPATANQALPGLDREARVLRYREKRKNRKFEKTIRYASRKAYAETRPRIKGRFAKRTEMEPVVDRMYSSTTSLMNDSGYGIVPSF